jgi:hypothetical protein
MQGFRIIVKPVGRESVQRRHLNPVKVWDPERKMMIETGQVTGQTKAKGAVEVLQFVPNLSKGRYDTGLEEMVVNPFKDMEVLVLKGKYLLSDNWDNVLSVVVKQSEITRQTWYEILDGTEPGYYTPAMSKNVQLIGPMRVTNEEKTPRTFIETFNVTLVDGANVFLWDHSRSRMAIQLLRNHPVVALNKDNYNSTVHNWYIALEDEEELSRVEVDDMENDALFELTSMQKNVPEDRLYRLAVILGLAKGEMSPLVVKDMLNRYIKNKADDKAQRIKKFMHTVQLFKEQEARFTVLFAVTQAINVNLLYFDNGYLYWKSKVEQAAVYRWTSTEAFVSFLEEEYQKVAPKKGTNKDNSLNYYAELVKELEARGVRV